MGSGKHSTSQLSHPSTKDATEKFKFSPPLSSGAHSGSPFNQKGLNPEVLKKVPLPNSKTPIRSDPEELPDVPLFVLLTTYLSFVFVILIGHVRDFFWKNFQEP
ncbi:serine palmitoyltransferase component [Entomophthora muscae]|uniref:Serine palmitoyltransferase component n=1 Tax=Entomophthora muscae TaxID=34485 RepID=A0ACC2RGE1_9FUNG|nr:serine palmitoyltransferase component [Entomophthora muscae]